MVRWGYFGAVERQKMTGKRWLAIGLALTSAIGVYTALRIADRKFMDL